MTRMDLFTLDFYWTKLNLKLAEQTFILKSFAELNLLMFTHK